MSETTRWIVDLLNKDISHYLPYASMVAGDAADRLKTPVGVRVAEQVIAAFIIGGVLLWGTVEVLDTRLTGFESRMGQRFDQVERDVESLNIEVRQIRDDFYVPRWKRDPSTTPEHQSQGDDS